MPVPATINSQVLQTLNALAQAFLAQARAIGDPHEIQLAEELRDSAADLACRNGQLGVADFIKLQILRDRLNC
jgi:hypothetical protein